MQGSKAGAVVVGVRACVEQQCGNFEVSVFHGEHQRRGVRLGQIATAACFRHRSIDVHPGFDQTLGNRHVSVAHGEAQRRKTSTQRSAVVGFGLDQGIDDVGVPLGGGPHQSGLATLLLRVDIRAGVDQCLDRAKPAGARCGHQHGLAAVPRCVRIGTRDKQQLDDLAIPVESGDRQRRDAVSIGQLDVCPRVDESFHRVGIIVVGCPNQRRHAVCLPGVDLGPLLKQEVHAILVALFDRVGNRGRRLIRKHHAGQCEVGNAPEQRQQMRGGNDSHRQNQAIAEPGKTTLDLRRSNRRSVLGQRRPCAAATGGRSPTG